MEFGCTGCGICCRKLGEVFAKVRTLPEPWQKEIAEFPYPLTATGACSMLVNNRCKVYKKRPVLCNVNSMHEKYFPKMDKKAYFDAAGRECNAMMDKAKSMKKRVEKH